MARIEIARGITTRYFNSLYPNENIGGATNIGGALIDSQNTIYNNIIKLDSSDFAGGIPTKIKFSLYASSVYKDLLRESSFALAARPLKNDLDIYNCTRDEASASVISDFGDVAYSEYADAWEAGKYISITSQMSSNEQDTKEFAKIVATSPLWLSVKYSYEGYDHKPYGATLTFDSSEGENPPFVEITLEEAEIYIANASPASGFVNKYVDTVFEWDIAYDDTNVIGTIKAETAKFRWRNIGEQTYNETEVSGNTYVMPAGVITSDIEWQVEVTSNTGTTAVSEWYGLTTTDATTIATPLSPTNIQIDGSADNVFKWTYSSVYGTLQTAAELQYSSDLLTWFALASVNDEQTSVVVLSNTLPSGTVYWRVRSYNQNGVEGAWSDPAVIKVSGVATPPNITGIETNTAAPFVMWTATNQAAYEVEVVKEKNIYKSGVVLSPEKRHKIKTLLKDGSYKLKVRIYETSGNASAWSEYSFTISTDKPITPIISAVPIVGGVKLNVVSDEEVYILRNDTPIGVVKNGEYIDYTAIGANSYIARAVSAINTFADSEQVKVAPLLIGSVISTAEAPRDMLQLTLNLNGQPQREMSWEQMGGITHYAGKSYPVYEYAEQESESYNFGFAFKLQSEFENFLQMAKQKKPIIYRDQYGLKVCGVITGASPSVNWAGYAVTFSMTRIDYNEAVEYDL